MAVLVESRMGAVTWAMRHRPVSHPRSSNRTCRFPASNVARHILCPNRARPDLCGGRSAMSVSTAISRTAGAPDCSWPQIGQTIPLTKGPARPSRQPYGRYCQYWLRQTSFWLTVTLRRALPYLGWEFRGQSGHCWPIKSLSKKDCHTSGASFAGSSNQRQSNVCSLFASRRYQTLRDSNSFAAMAVLSKPRIGVDGARYY
jgi:hypothetical protein